MVVNNGKGALALGGEWLRNKWEAAIKGTLQTESAAHSAHRESSCISLKLFLYVRVCLVLGTKPQSPARAPSALSQAFLRGPADPFLCSTRLLKYLWTMSPPPNHSFVYKYFPSFPDQDAFTASCACSLRHKLVCLHSPLVLCMSVWASDVFLLRNP